MDVLFLVYAEIGLGLCGQKSTRGGAKVNARRRKSQRAAAQKSTRGGVLVPPGKAA
jgi:hypothetical protein